MIFIHLPPDLPRITPPLPFITVYRNYSTLLNYLVLYSTHRFCVLGVDTPLQLSNHYEYDVTTIVWFQTAFVHHHIFSLCAKQKDGFERLKMRFPLCLNEHLSSILDRLNTVQQASTQTHKNKLDVSINLAFAQSNRKNSPQKIVFIFIFL